MPSTQCPNCKRRLGCTCKLRKASNGATCCNVCLQSYNNKLKQLKK